MFGPINVLFALSGFLSVLFQKNLEGSALFLGFHPIVSYPNNLEMASKLSEELDESF